MTNPVRTLQPTALWNHFEDINAVPRPSKKEERIIAFMKAFGEGLGLKTVVDSIGNVIIYKAATPGMEDRKTVILQSHLDMVHQKNADTNFDFSTQGIQSYIDGEWVKKIMHVDSVANKSITKEFEYKNSAGQSSGQVLFNPVLFYNYHSMDQYGGYPVYRIHGDAISPLFPNQGSPVLYTQVLEKITGPDGDIRIRHYMTGFDAYSSTIYRNMCCGVPFNKHPIRSDLVGIEIQTETYKYEGGAYNLTSSNT